MSAYVYVGKTPVRATLKKPDGSEYDVSLLPAQTYDLDESNDYIAGLLEYGHLQPAPPSKLKAKEPTNAS